jgi:hypothetical protein
LYRYTEGAEGAAGAEGAEEGAEGAAAIGIAWEPAAPPAKELYLRQTLLKLLNALRREQGVQVLGVIAELILPSEPAGAAEESSAASPVPVLTGAFGVCWPGGAVQVDFS